MKRFFIEHAFTKDEITLLLTLVTKHRDLALTKVRIYRILGDGYERTIEDYEKLIKRYNFLWELFRNMIRRY